MPKHPVRASAPNLAGVVPYDPKYIPAEVMISANENPDDVDQEVRREIEHEIRKVHLNRYPDPLANGLRDLIAEANGLDRDNVIVGNGGDELLFNIALAYGGPGRTMLNIPPTFSVYAYNAMLTRTNVVDIPRLPDFSIDEDAVVQRVAKGDIDYLIITSPNNPTGDLASEEFVRRVLDASDTLVMVDEAYFEFSRRTVRPLLNEYDNLVILRTFSKAFSLAGVRLGYLPKRYAAYGEKAFYGTCDRHLGVGADGALQLGGICLVAGLGGATRRDGSLAYYFSEPVVENDAKGVGPLLLAYTEILAARKK